MTKGQVLGKFAIGFIISSFFIYAGLQFEENETYTLVRLILFVIGFAGYGVSFFMLRKL